ncbi:hypothetical protein [Kribbella sindirgiensis]|uniref:Uncharacterized protein n=1 Tax=Kribbella sindirgiensis TaxID=1124744 RepID=A0A4R0IQS9_9ACTN|nr:hypothetical protein [Kribbella sindirgiensis]TCC34960.1 hypothetical protein E0H50_13805 [Kribbella sindirgiensis]
MSVETSTAGRPPSPPNLVVLILAVTVVAFAAIVILALAGHAIAAGVIGTVWAATCGVLGYKKP